MATAEILREKEAPAPGTTPMPEPPPPPPAPEAEAPKSIVEQYRADMQALIPRFEAATKSAQESIFQRQQDLAGYRERVVNAPGVPEPPKLPEAPPAPKITARPFLESMPGEPAVQSLQKMMAGFGLMAQMAVGIKGGFPSGALAAYTGALEGWKAGDQRRASDQWANYMAELQQHDRDVRVIRQQYDDAIRKWGADQDRLKTELGIIAAEHNLGREAIEMSFQEPQRAFEMINTTAKVLSDMQTSAASIALKNAMWLADRELKLKDLALKEQELAIKSKEAGPKLSDENSLRQQFLTQSKDFVTIRDSYARLSEAGKNPSAAGDLAIIFNYMKMLDPGSVVRESEFANAQNAAGVPERIRAQYNRVLSGERLTDVTRQDFVNQAGGQYKAQLGGQKQLEEQFRGVASRAGMDPSQVVVDFAGGMSARPGGVAPPGVTLPPGAKMDGGQIVSESGKFVWDGSQWRPR